MKLSHMLTVFAALAIGAVAGASAADVQAGKSKAGPCAPCHGLNGNSPDPRAPALAARRLDYLQKAMRAISVIRFWHGQCNVSGQVSR